MPNPIKNMNREIFKKLSDKQKSMVNNMKKRHGITMSKLKVYQRAGSRSGYSVHNPIMDAQRRSRNKSKASKYPQARDTPFQSKHSGKGNKQKYKKKSLKRNVGVKRPKSFLSQLFSP